jgi:hypothetical protein
MIFFVCFFRSPEGGAKTSNNGSSSGDENVTDQFAKSDRNTLKKSRNDNDSAEIMAVRRNVIQAKGRPTPKTVSDDNTQK